MRILNIQMFYLPCSWLGNSAGWSYWRNHQAESTSWCSFGFLLIKIKKKSWCFYLSALTAFPMPLVCGTLGCLPSLLLQDLCDQQEVEMRNLQQTMTAKDTESQQRQSQLETRLQELEAMKQGIKCKPSQVFWMFNPFAPQMSLTVGGASCISPRSLCCHIGSFNQP